MTAMTFLRAYGAGLLTMLALDLLWLGVIARGFYAREFGSLMAPAVRWAPGLAFYAIYAAAIVVLVVQPAVERDSLTRAVATGALLGLAAYAAFDLTGLALLRDFPVRAAFADLAWGTVVTAAVAAAAFLAVRGSA